MKVLITSDSYLPRLGGAEVYAYKLATHLKMNGYEVEIFTTEPGEWIKDHENLTHRHIWSRNPIKMIRFIYALYKQIKKVDYVHSIYAHKLAAISGIICLFTRKKLVVSLQGRGILDLPGNNFYYAFLHRTYRSISLKLSHKIIASCHEFSDIAARYTRKEKIIYMPNSVDVNDFGIETQNYSLLPFKYNGETLVFTLRRLVPKNGIQFLIESIPHILKRDNKVKFVLIGWGPMEGYLKKRVKDLVINDYVHFLGRIENSELNKYLSLADMVVFPSTAESTSIACLECMYMKKPIIASNVGGYPEMVSHNENGYLVNLTDKIESDYGAPMTLPEEKLVSLAEAVHSLIVNPDKKTSFGNKSRELIEQKFSWHKNIKEIIKIYKSI